MNVTRRQSNPRRLGRIRPALVWVHRYVGLAIALFLVVAGLTGSVSVFKNELDALMNPSLFRASPPPWGSEPLEPLKLREAAERQLPQGISISEVPLTPPESGRTVLFNLSWDGPEAERPMDQAFVDPYTGKVLGTRNHLDLREGIGNLVPFLFRLHYSLGLEEVGAWLLGIVAVLWTIDCFVALVLTFPPTLTASSSARPGTRKSWLVRWWPSWLIRSTSLFATVFTFHRASGLWTWIVLLLFAWSSVALLMMPVYEPIMHTIFNTYKYDPKLPLEQPRHHPRLSWIEALENGQKLMQAESIKRGFTIIRPFILSHEPDYGFYRYQVQSSLDPSDHWCDTLVLMDSNTGEFVDFDAPTGADVGRTITTWLIYLHFGWVGGLIFRILICLVGIDTAALSVTGVLIWWKKRSLRRRKQLGDRLNVETSMS